MKHCPECGTELYESDQEFCQNCGSDLTRYERLAHQEQVAEQSQLDEPILDSVDNGSPEAFEESQVSDSQSEQADAGREHVHEPVVFELDQMDGYQFEEAVVTLFQRLGYDAEQTTKAADEGRDVLVHDGDSTIVVECKHRKGNIGRPVVQKLQAATSSYPGATKGIVVTSGGFANTAHDYAQEASRATSVDIDLWDYGTLVKKAQQADLYFTTERKGTDFVFRPGYRSEERLKDGVWKRHLAGLDCEPRDLEDAISVRHDGLMHIPAVLVEYDVDQHFESATYHLHHARNHGRMVLPLAREDLPDHEQRFWQQATFNVTCEDTMDGQPVQAFFGEPLEPVKKRVAERIAAKNTTTVSYKGKNNQRYTQHCKVDPSDVKVDAKQVLLLYHEVGIEAGPQEHEVLLTAEWNHDWLVTGMHGFDDGDGGFRDGDGFVCNDCGLISPRRGEPCGAACEECGRTLCASHHWTWPKKAPWPSPDLCSACYEAQDHESQYLADTPEFLDSELKTSLYGLAPGVPFLMGERWLAGMALLPVWLLLIAAVGLVVETGNVAAAVVAMGFGWMLSVPAAWYWSRRVRLHEENQEGLTGYEPEWNENADPAGEDEEGRSGQDPG